MEKKQKINLTAIIVLAVTYFVTGKLGLTMALVHPSATAVWPCTGIALASFLIFGYDLWPGALVAAFLVNITAGSVATCLGITKQVNRIILARPAVDFFGLRGQAEKQREDGEEKGPTRGCGAPFRRSQ